MRRSSNLFQVFDNIQRALAAGERIFEVLDTEPDIQDPEHPVAMPHLTRESGISRTSFSAMPPARKCCMISTCSPTRANAIALVGRSGAGKTSFINLIPRFYEVREGQVLVDGMDVRARAPARPAPADRAGAAGDFPLQRHVAR